VDLSYLKAALKEMGWQGSDQAGLKPR